MPRKDSHGGGVALGERPPVPDLAKPVITTRTDHLGGREEGGRRERGGGRREEGEWGRVGGGRGREERGRGEGEKY